jgi:hypothetical protein
MLWPYQETASASEASIVLLTIAKALSTVPAGTVEKQTNKTMKTNNNIRKLTLITSLALAMAVGASLSVQAQEKGSSRGAAQQLMKPVKTVADLEALQPGDMIAMSCPKCKDVTVTHVVTPIKRTDPASITSLKHLCPGCATAIKTEGRGKAAKDVIVHVCKKCGSEDAFCCSLKKPMDDK